MCGYEGKELVRKEGVNLQPGDYGMRWEESYGGGTGPHKKLLQGKVVLAQI